ncbi:uncharacterized protein LOC135346877 isoform X4 [Halichondria panicea]|uniref:uncharacterized protein LOC135346877 isoform X4 n=1 Tax=Halichondria panicea TaxID=6063 RepID=UPI00312B410D
MSACANNPVSTIVLSPSCEVLHLVSYIHTSCLESKRLFDEGMKHGHVLVNIVNMLVFGPAGTGKTNLKHLLTNKPPPLQRDSTPCMEKPVRIRPVSNAKFRSTGRGWEEMSQSKLRNLLAQIIAKLPKESTDPSTASRVAESLKKMTTTEPRSISGSDEQLSDSDEPFSDCSSSNDSDEISGSAKLDEAIDEVIASVVSGVAEELKPASQGTDQLSSSDQQEGELFDSNWVYVTDCGGQPQFHDISPLFIKHISVALIVLRLIDELSSFPSDEYYKDGQLVGSPHASHMTLGETLQSLIRSIESHTSQDKKPKMIFVGTFLDQLKSLNTLTKRNQEILDMLPPDIKKLLVYEDLGLNNLIFGLNTISRDDDSLATANRIRITVERSIPLQVKMPIWWSFLDSLLQSLSATLERGVLSKQECLRLATRFRYALQDLEAALDFFDEVCIAHYYPSILPNTVFVDAQIPLDKITELSQHAISLRSAEVKSHSTLSSGGIEAEWKRFRDEGIINLKFLRFFEKHYVEGIFSPEDMLLIMKKLLVIAPIPLVESTTHQVEFFMPSLLKSAPIAELDKVRSSSVPLAIHFPSGCIRSGVFCCTVVDVMRRLGWEAVLPSSGPILFAKNCIQFRIPSRPCVISLVDSFSRIEVYVEAPPPLRKELCPIVCSQLMESIKAACVVLNYNNDTPKAAIFCPCKKSGNKLHVADVSVDGYWMCSLHAREWGELSDQHRIWLDNSEGSGEASSDVNTEGKRHQLQYSGPSSPVMEPVCRMSDQYTSKDVSGASSSATRGTCTKTERRSDQQQYSSASSSVTGDMCTKMTLSDQQQQSGKPSSATGDTLMKTERKSHQQQYSGELSSVTVMEDVCKKTGVRDQQLDQEIPESDIILIAEKFPHLLNVHKALTMTDLQHVYEKLKSASPHWFNLGLALGLTHPDLTNINIKCREDNVLCLREMLAKLLSTQHVTWSLLSDGLKRPTVDLINLADSITGKPSSATGGTCTKTERKSDQQQYSVHQCGTLANVVSSTGSGMSDQQPCLSEHGNSVMEDVCLKTEVHDHDQHNTSDKLSPAMEHVVNTTSDQHTIMEDVCKKTGVRDQQLDQEIPESDIILIAEKFPHLLNVHKALTINDLQHVYEKLHESASPHWFNLGLALGLTHPDLTNINIKCREDNVLCLREMLAKLLSTQHVTWSLLSDALRRPTVDLINLADSITGKPSSATGGTCTERKSDQQQYSNTAADVTEGDTSQDVLTSYPYTIPSGAGGPRTVTIEELKERTQISSDDDDDDDSIDSWYSTNEPVEHHPIDEVVDTVDTPSDVTDPDILINEQSFSQASPVEHHPTASDEATCTTALQSTHRTEQHTTASTVLTDAVPSDVTEGDTSQDVLTSYPHTIPSGAGGPRTVTIEELKERTKVTDSQLDTEIEETDMIVLADHFDNVETYPAMLGLSPAEQKDVKLDWYLNDMQTAMFHTLKVWRQHNPGAATYRALVDIVLDMRMEELATYICQSAARKPEPVVCNRT